MDYPGESRDTFKPLANRLQGVPSWPGAIMPTLIVSLLYLHRPLLVYAQLVVARGAGDVVAAAAGNQVNWRAGMTVIPRSLSLAVVREGREQP